MKTYISWYADQFGRILGPCLHDSHLVGFEFYDEGEHAFILHLITEQKKRIIVKCLGVAEINFEHFCNGAIISDIYLWKINSAPQNLDILDNVWNILFSDRYKSTDMQKNINTFIQKYPELLLLHVECSYGGAVAFVCKYVEILNP